MEQRVVLCGSMSVYPQMRRIQRELRMLGVPSVTPSSDPRVDILSESEQFQAHKRRAALRHIRRIRSPRTHGILAVNLDRYGIADYVGPNTFAEIAIAFAHSKQVYLYQGIPRAFEEELSAWMAIPLFGALGRIAVEFSRWSRSESAQLELFGK